MSFLGASKHTGQFLAIVSALLLVATGHLAAQEEQEFPERIPDLIEPSVEEDNSHVTTTQVRTALGGLSAAEVVSISFGTSDHSGFDVFSTAATSFPVVGSTYFVMSTGNTSSALTANTAPNTSTILGGLNTSEGEDLLQITLVLNPPAGATCLAFDFQFFSEEFPEFVGSEFNDAFIAELDEGSPTPFQIVEDQVIAPDNFAFDTDENVISVNTVFGVTAGNANGTTYDGGTPLLTAVTPVGTANFTVTLSIMDLGDSIFDSTVFIDNFRWFFGLACVAGADADSDGDSLLDDWEINGIDFDNDGTVDLDLPAFGADPDHKDVFIEIDYMVLGGAGGHTHKPKGIALQIVIDMFANAPVTNPDGICGITAHIDAGTGTIMDPVANTMWGALSRSDVLAHQNNLGGVTGVNYDWTDFDAIKVVSFDIQRADVFHYCIFGHSLAPAFGFSSGISRGIGASDFLVTMGGWDADIGTANQQGGTLGHEFGHNLNLRHGGDDNRNRKPNYLSIMSYSFQTRGLRIGGFDGNFDYSRFVLPTLNEASLNETIGLSGVAEAAGYGTRYTGPFCFERLVDSLTTIDWNRDGDALDNPVAQDINKDPIGTGTFEGVGLAVLTGFDDWDAIVYNGGSVGHLGEAIVLPMDTVSDSITVEIDSVLATDFAVCISGPGEVDLEECQMETYEYTITNTGDCSDTYDIDTSSTEDFGDLSVFPATLFLDTGESEVFEVVVTISEGETVGTLDEVEIVVTSQANPLIADVAETTTEVISPTDNDGDGFSNFCDACPDSDTAATIVIDGCDSGVTNLLFDDGCFMKDLILECAADAANHGDFVSCVSDLTNGWKEDGLISGGEKGKIESCAASR